MNRVVVMYPYLDYGCPGFVTCSSSSTEHSTLAFNLFAQGNTSTHVRIRYPALMECTLACEKVALETLRLHTGEEGTRIAVHNMSEIFCSMVRQIVCSLIDELSKETKGSFSVSLSKLAASIGDPTSLRDLFCRLMPLIPRYTLLIQLSSFESHALPESCRTLVGAQTMVKNRLFELMLPGFLRAIRLCGEVLQPFLWAIDLLSIKVSDSMWDFRLTGGTSFDLALPDPHLVPEDLPYAVSRWRKFQVVDGKEIMPAYCCVPRILSESLTRLFEGLQANCVLSLHTDMMRRNLHAELKLRISGYRYITSRLCGFFVSARLVSSRTDDGVLPECVRRLAKGGFATHEESCHPFYPLLIERMGSRLQLPYEFVCRVLSALSLVRDGRAPSNIVSGILRQLVLIHLLGTPVNPLWVFLKTTTGLTLTFSESDYTYEYIEPEVYAVLDTCCAWNQSVLADRVRMRLAIPYTDFVFAAEYAGEHVRVVLRLQHPDTEEERVRRWVTRDEIYQVQNSSDSHNCSVYERTTFLIHVDPLGTTRLREPPLHFLDQHGRPVTLIKWVFGASSGIMEALGVPYGFVNAMSSNESVDLLFKSMKIRLPWWDVSTRRRVYYNYMGRKIGVPFAYAKMLVRKYKATGLSLLECNERVSSIIELPLKLLGKFSNDTERFRVLMNIPPSSTVTNVRLLVRYLLLWGTELMEILEVKSFLLRRRIYSWTSGKLTEALLKQSRLSLGTQVSVMIVTASMQ